MVALVLLLAASARLAPAVSAQSQPDAVSKVATAFAAVVTAENAGANVSDLDTRLNMALGLISQGEAVQVSNPSGAQSFYSQAEAIASQVVTEAQAEQNSARASENTVRIVLGTEFATLGVAAVLVYLYLPTLFWAIWFWLNRDSTVAKA